MPVSPEQLEAVDGHLSTVLNELTIPLDSLLTNGESTPFPQIQEIPSFSDIVAVSRANVSINEYSPRLQGTGSGLRFPRSATHSRYNSTLAQ